MSAETLIKRGLREFDLRPWELREGRMMITFKFLNEQLSVGMIRCQNVSPNAPGEL
jgi:hypothetical protein